MLLQNPQLAYAVLQAQVVMKIVDPETAITMLHKPQPPAPPVGVGYGARPSSLTSSGPPNFGPPFSGGAGPGGGGAPSVAHVWQDWDELRDIVELEVPTDEYYEQRLVYWRGKYPKAAATLIEHLLASQVHELLGLLTARRLHLAQFLLL